MALEATRYSRSLVLLIHDTESLRLLGRKLLTVRAFKNRHKDGEA